MEATSSSLLLPLRQPGEQASWQRFVDLYTPLLSFWACRMGLSGDDAADRVQDVSATLVQKLPQFEYDPGKSFRAWHRRRDAR
jgi:RNA polymerase sigma-70 factor (ECF subfamily)